MRAKTLTAWTLYQAHRYEESAAKAREIIELDPSARVIMCSALGQESKVLESIKLGARDFVVKPFQAERVLERLQKRVESEP